MRLIENERGMALFVSMIAMMLLGALAASLVVGSMSETLVSANFRAAASAHFAAAAGLEETIAALRTEPVWTDVPGGAAMAAFSDGAPTGPRALADGAVIDLDAIVNMATCHRPAPCSAAQAAAFSDERPWGANNPRWRIYAHGYLSDLVAAAFRDRACYIVGLVADDPSENDSDPAHDGVETGGVANPGNGVLAIRAEAFCERRAHRIIEATIARSGTGSDDSARGLVIFRREIN